MRTQADRQSLSQFVRAAGVTMTAERVDENPNMHDGDMDHWKVVLRVGRSRMTLVFSKGLGHHGKEPSISEVLDCLASHSSSVTDSFESWCSGWGMDPDSRKAFTTYRVCEKQAERLKKLLGPSAYDTLLYNVDRE